jgi:hypothetical protein
MFPPSLGHHQALQRNQAEFLNGLNMDPYYDLLSLSQRIHLLTNVH